MAIATAMVTDHRRAELGIESGMITTVHNITGTQSLVDMPNTKKKDLRRARSGMLNLAPTTTGSATAVAEVRSSAAPPRCAPRAAALLPAAPGVPPRPSPAHEAVNR